jgi:hypothetical protein
MSTTSSALPDFAILGDPRSPKFLDEVTSAHVFIDDSRISEFFDLLLTVLRDLDPEIPDDRGQEIIRCICRIISMNPTHRKAFVNPEYIRSLFESQRFREDILDIFSVLIAECPTLFDKSIAQKLATKVRFTGRRGQKILVLLFAFAQQLDQIDDPFPMLDLLFDPNGNARFIRDDLAAQYAILFGILVRKCPEFRRQRGNRAWEVICTQLLPLQNPEILIAAYDSCCVIASHVRHVQFPFEVLKDHCCDPVYEGKLVPSVLSLLLVVDLQYEKLRDTDLLATLIEVASGPQGRPAALALMKLAGDRTVARKLAIDIPGWMARRLPEIEETLRIFLVVFQCERLRLSLAEADSFLPFLRNLLDEGNTHLHCIVSKILRRIFARIEADDRTFVEKLASEGFLKDYLAEATDLNSPNVWLGVLQLLELLANYGYQPELRIGCRITVALAKGREFADLCESALTVATKLARYPKCADELRKSGMVELARRIAQDPARKGLARELVQAIQDDRR